MTRIKSIGILAVFFLGLIASGACDSAPDPRQGEARSSAAVELAPRGTVQRAELRDGDGIIDGDTLRAVGFGQSIRLLCIDTEESLEGEDLEAASRDWDAYRRAQTEGADGPANYGTFLGNEATRWAEQFFEGNEEIFVEYQSPQRTRGFYGRHLAYVWVRDGEEGPWINYNIEAVRAGMTPYFTAYGWCEKYHDHFVAAQEQARAAGRGIWAEGARGYDDYDQRLEQWERRARQIGLFRSHFADRSNMIELGTDTAMARLRLANGQRVIVFGALSRHFPGAQPPRIELYHRHREEFSIVADEGLSFERFDVELTPQEFYYVEGTVELFRGNPQLRVDMRSFIHTGERPPPL